MTPSTLLRSGALLSSCPQNFTSICSSSQRTLHKISRPPAKVAPVIGTSPLPPQPAAQAESPALSRLRSASHDLSPSALAKLERRTRQAEMIRQAREMRAQSNKSSSQRQSPPAAASKYTITPNRFWKQVHVRQVENAYEVHLDARKVRHPATKEVIRIPQSKPHLAHALAMEWDSLSSAVDAKKQHLVPLTGLVCRAFDIADDDARHDAQSIPATKAEKVLAPPAPVRASIANMLLRYLDTDSLLCWAPPATDANEPSLRELQRKTALPIVTYLTTNVWPGTSLDPVLGTHSIIPRSQPEGTREVVREWVLGLPHWELAGLERAVLAGKSLLGAARLVVEWSETLGMWGDGERFGVEEAARAASLEVDWQIRRWGEVEDTHDVEREDVRRQLGSAVLLVGGVGEQGELGDNSAGPSGSCTVRAPSAGSW